MPSVPSMDPPGQAVQRAIQVFYFRLSLLCGLVGLLEELGSLCLLQPLWALLVRYKFGLLTLPRPHQRL